jgi:hypothetical protein
MVRRFGLGLMVVMATSAFGIESSEVNDAFTQTIEAKMESDVDGFTRTDMKIAENLAEIREKEQATRRKLRGFKSRSPEEMKNALGEWNKMIDAAVRMREKMLTLAEYSGEHSNIRNAMNERIARARETAMNVTRVVGALEEVDNSGDRRLAHRGVGRAAQRTGRSHVPATARAATTAGGAELLDVYLGGSYTTFDDDAAESDGSEWETTLGTSFLLSDALTLGVSLNYSEYEIGGITDVERQSSGIEMDLLYEYSDELAIAVFGGYSRVDVEDAIVVDPLLGAISLGDNYDNWNAGIAVSLNREIGGFDVGLTPSLVALDGEDPGGLLDFGRTAALILVDCQKGWNDDLSSIVFASHFQALGDDVNGDRSYWTVGGELSWAVNDRVVIGVGYEKTLGYEDYSDNRFLGNVTWNF